CCSWSCLFFFSSRRRHTRSKRDWSSDVCSSDLFHIQSVRCGEAAPFPFQQPRRVQFIQRPLYGGAAFIQYFGYLRDGIDNINPALAVLPLVLLGEGGAV